jgi:hypothetical protein
MPIRGVLFKSFLSKAIGLQRDKVSVELPDTAWQIDTFLGFFDSASLPFAKLRVARSRSERQTEVVIRTVAVGNVY